MTRSIKGDVLSHYLDKVLEEEVKEVKDDDYELDDSGNVILDVNGDPVLSATKKKRDITPEERRGMELMQGIFMAAMSGDGELIRAVRGGMVIEAGVNNWCARADDVSDRVALKIGYLAGTFQPEVGNRVLKAFNARHPYWGLNIPDEQSMMFDMARVIDDQYRIARTKEEEVRRKAARGKSLGVAVPGAEEEVTSADATALLKAMRDKDAALKAAKAAKIEAAEKAKIAAEIAEKKSAAETREDAPFEF